MKNYIYINENLIESSYNQLPPKARTEINSKGKLSIENFSPKFELEIERIRAQPSAEEKIEAIEKHYRKNNKIHHERPIDKNDKHENNFFLESTTAKKYHIPITKNFPFPDLKGISVWISDPDPSTFSEKSYEYRGTFLYLIETLYEDTRNTYCTTISGCSALQAIVNMATGKKLFDNENWGREPYGRWNHDHPGIKLGSIGAFTTGETRPIKTLYMRRYITDEQSYFYKARKMRVNDLLAYPLYISSI